ncbi:EAL domain-containing protein [Pararobbsia silviterrae]|uniref:EAL domain-containing protein n=1 Tax=Pararobbsia silviterrae TaxID=1792498 RepID=A0A494Y8E5_9BURK|nr:EAL domain-containing response regulator [Pararobbsia silviterrae]RKP56586.1 EAL domain-containing protein [Pararobbsia silviterrae]
MTTPAPPIRSVLLVDDSATQRHAVEAILRGLGVAEVVHAGDGVQALAILAEPGYVPDVMIVDLEMPVMDGVELMQQLRQRGLSIPMIVASSREGSLVRAVVGMARNLGLPVIAGLHKPLTRSMLSQALTSREHAERRRVDPSAAHAGALDPGALEQAIRAGAIVPHYQPKVDIGRGLLRGVEVLARWTDDTLGPVPPDRFIAAAERGGLIFDLSLSVMDQAIAQAAIWNARGLKLSIALNVSPILLSEPNIVDAITHLLDKHGVGAPQIVLEITESSVVSPDGPALGALARLRLRGFGLSIDDYGTGLSSMQQLARIPFTELKVDRSFVHHAHRHENLRVILESALTMAHRLKLVTVAEGVETIEDWRLLQRYGCDVGQGYLIGKPMSADALLPWIKEYQERMPSLRAQRSTKLRSAARATTRPSGNGRGST